MSNRFTAGMTRLIDRMSEQASVSITYHRANGDSVTLATGAWVGRTAFRRNSSDSVAGVVFSDRDFLIPVALLVVGSGSPFEPAEGDWIQEGGTKYRVSAPDGEPAVRHSDQTELLWRIHTKLTEV